MKNLYLIVCLLLSPFALLAQNIHGLWAGTMVNDTLQVTQNFELALSEYRGKITGYTYQTYIIRDTFYYSVKRVRAERKDGFLVVEDVERIGENFPDKAAKKVKLTAKFPLINDTTIDFLKGHWSTNQTKVFYSVGGDMQLAEQPDKKQSDLLAHLEEMNVKTDIAIHQKEKKKDGIAARNSEPTTPQQKNNKKVSETKPADVVKNSKTVTVDKNTSPQINSIQKADASRSADNKGTNVASGEVAAGGKGTNVVSNNNSANENNATIQNSVAKQEPVPGNRRTQQNSVADPNKGTAQIKSVPQVTIPEQKKTMVQPVVDKKPVTAEKIDQQKVINTASISKPVIQNKELVARPKELPTIVAERKNESIQDLYFRNDSLVLSLYDNGIVDGDTVSVFMNGENIISKQRLKEAATKKTIYISSNADSVQLVLFAENLGSIPPNTGLLTVRDGDDVYQVRFSADLQKNASIMLRRRKD